MRLLVAIPCLNEANTIRSMVEDIPRSIIGISGVDVLVIDDGSTDGSRYEAEAGGAHVISHSENRGVGAAFQTAVAHAVEKGYDIMVNIDADRQFNPADISKLVLPVLKGESDMVTASRFIDASYTPEIPKIKLWGNYAMSYLISKLLRRKYADVSCGFRCYNRECLLHLNLHGAFTYTQETFIDFIAKKIKIKEIPIKVVYYPDRESRVAGSIVKYAISTAKIIFKGYRDYYPLRFFWGLAFIFLVPATIFGAIFLAHYINTGQFSGSLYAGFSSAFFFAIGILLIILGVLADMLDRVRSNQERMLYQIKKHFYDHVDKTNTKNH